MGDTSCVDATDVRPGGLATGGAAAVPSSRYKYCTCEFWHAVVYDLGIALRTEIEACVSLLLRGKWPYPLLSEWQRKLRCCTAGTWFRYWLGATSFISDLTRDPPTIRLSLVKIPTLPTNKCQGKGKSRRNSGPRQDPTARQVSRAIDCWKASRSLPL